MKPTVTIFADASVDPKTKVAGWACWIKANGAESIIRGAPLKKPVVDSTEAELSALANAVAVAAAVGVLSGHVLLQSDSADALSCILWGVKGAIQSPARDGYSFQRRRRAPRKEYHAAIAAIDNARRKTGITIAVRHVRGHQEGDGRQWVNRKCDEVAKRFMRERRAEIRQQSGAV